MRQSAFLCATIVAASFAGVALPAHGQQARREHAAATRSQTQKTDKANQDAAVADEASGASEGAQPSRAGRPNANQVNGNGKPAPPSYGPMLNPRQPKGADPARKDPAEVRDETDSLAREAQSQQPGEQLRQLRQQSQNPRQVQRRHPAWQSVGPLAPRSSGSADSPAIGTGAVPIPPPAQAPQPVVPSSRALNCVGGACLDAAGGSYNLGPTGVGVSSSGRLCSSSGTTTVQCF